MNKLDRYDRLLLAELQRDSRQTVQQLATAVGLSSTPCWKRVKELEACGVIRRYTALVDKASPANAQVKERPPGLPPTQDRPGAAGKVEGSEEVLLDCGHTHLLSGRTCGRQPLAIHVLRFYSLVAELLVERVRLGPTYRTPHRHFTQASALLMAVYTRNAPKM